MARFISRKLVHVVLVLFLVSIALAFMLELSPTDPAYAIVGEHPTAEQIARVHEELNLDAPLHERYWDWVSGVLQGDFGQSYVTKVPVAESIRERVPVTLEVILLAFLIALAISIPLGIYTAFRADGRFDRCWHAVSSAMISIPPFVSALLLSFVFAIVLRNSPLALPATGWAPFTEGPLQNLRYAVLPAVTLALAEVPVFARVLRADMIATLSENYILAARARGVPVWRILFRHALRPSSFSLVTITALTLGRLLGGSVVVESVFALPGLGNLVIQNIRANDVPVVQGVVMFVAVSYVLINACTDVVYGFLDPRVRTRGA